MGCQLMANALGRSPYGIEVCALAGDSSEVRSAVEKTQPQVAVIGLLKDGPNMNLKMTQELSASDSKTKVIELIEPDAPLAVIEALQAGARGVVCRDDPFEMLCKCIHVVHQGQIWINTTQLEWLLDYLVRATPLSTICERNSNQLTGREESVVRLVAEGLTNREISHQLNLSEHTVRNYLFRIFDKLGTSTRLELAVLVNSRRKGHEIVEHRKEEVGSEVEHFH